MPQAQIQTYTDHDIYRVRTANPLADVISRNVSLGEHSIEGLLSGTCIFCEDNRGEFIVSPLLNLYLCRDCNETGDVITWVRKLDGVTYMQAIELLAERAGVEITRCDRA